MSNNVKRIKALVGGMNTKHKNLAKYHKNYPIIERYSTGSVLLDVSLGGGLPVGRVALFLGEKSSGKTTTAVRIAGRQQRLCANCHRPVADWHCEKTYDEETEELIDVEVTGTCDCVAEGLFEVLRFPDEKHDDFVKRRREMKENSFEPFQIVFIDAEHSFDASWYGKLGMDPDLCLIIEPDTAEEAIDVQDTLIRSGAVDFIILDSIAALTPSKEIEASTEEWQQGLGARLFNKGCRKFVSSMAAARRYYGKKVTQVWINQIREKIGVTFGDNRSTPYGKMQNFAASIEVFFWPSKLVKDKVGDKLTDEFKMDAGSTVRTNFKTEKNKTYTAKITGSYRMSLRDGSIDDWKLVTQACDKYGIIRSEGRKWLLGDSQEFETKTKLLEYLKEPEVFAQVCQHIVQKMVAREF